ncbi:MAG TPA: MFS transporter, partial [Actinomycetota bacterium]|nr:MFS transporter [Actinomycetota bacterium]
YFVAIGSIIPTVPRFVEGPLGGTNVSVGLVVGSFAFTAVLLRPLVGSIGDRKGRRILIVSGASIVGASIVAYVAVESLPLLVALRLVMGAGEAAFYVGAASAINDLAPDERRGEALSIFSLALYGGIAIGTVAGETILDVSDFTAVWIAAGGSALAAALLGFIVPDTRPDLGEVEHVRRWVHPSGLKPGTILATSVLGLAGFNTFIPLYTLDIGMSGSRFVFFTFSAIVLTIRSFGARIPDILGARRAATYALIASTVGLAVLALWAEPIGIYTGAVLFGVGQALAFPALMTIALSGAPAAERGAVVGTFTAFFDLAFGLGAVALGAVSALLGYRGLFLTAALVSLSGLVLMRAYVQRARVLRNVDEARRPEPV